MMPRDTRSNGVPRAREESVRDAAAPDAFVHRSRTDTRKGLAILIANPLCLLVAGARNHLQANWSVDFRFQIQAPPSIQLVTTFGKARLTTEKP